MEGEEGVAEEADLEEDGAFALGILAGGEAEEGGGFEIERFGLGGEVCGAFAFVFGSGGFCGHLGDASGV